MSTPDDRYDLEAWRERLGWSIRQACEELDIEPNRWRRMVGGGRIPRHMSLACRYLEATNRRRRGPTTTVANPQLTVTR